jgi:hypothetical protein
MSLAVALLALAGAPAPPAGETACWYERGVVVVPAEVAGIAGDFILDTAAPQTLIAETQAQAAGYAEPAVTGDVRLAGRVVSGLAMAVKDIDVRTGLFATPIAGVIGADALKGYVVDVSVGPCRVALHPPGRAPAFGRATALPLDWLGGAPAVAASAADGGRAISGAFVLATGSDTAVRLNDRFAAAPGAAKPQELYPYGLLRPRLRALSLAGDLAEQVPSGLIKADAAEAGEIGAPLLFAWRVRFDFPAGRLLLAPKRKGPGSRRGP